MKFNEYSLWKLINEALRSPNHKRCFSFALKYLYDFNFAQPFCPFSPVSTRPCQNWQTNLKSYGSSREKLKHLLWLEDLKASLINCPEKNIHKTSSTYLTSCSMLCYLHLFKIIVCGTGQ